MIKVITPIVMTTGHDAGFEKITIELYKRLGFDYEDYLLTWKSSI